MWAPGEGGPCPGQAGGRAQDRGSAVCLRKELQVARRGYFPHARGTAGAYGPVMGALTIPQKDSMSAQSESGSVVSDAL